MDETLLLSTTTHTPIHHSISMKPVIPKRFLFHDLDDNLRDMDLTSRIQAI